ncbi:MAG: ABC transporter substrate binding protein [Nitrosomonas ureae]
MALTLLTFCQWVRQLLTAWIVLLAMSASAISAVSPNTVIAVLYPETGMPYQQIFSEIISGIEKGAEGAAIRSMALPDPPNLSALRHWLDQQSPTVTITLGRIATETYEALDSPIPQVIGAFEASLQTRPRIAGISLSVDPALLLDTLKKLAPAINRVWVIFNPNTDRWVVDLAQSAAPVFGLEIQTLEASDLRESARRFLDVLERAEPTTDSIWLLANSALVDSQTILPLVVEQSWKRRLVIFSNSLQQAKYGILFALYPDNLQLGRHLAELAQSHVRQPHRAFHIEPLRAVKRVLNLKVAAHLKLSITKDIEQQFDVVLPPW